VAEPLVQKEGTDRIIVELPGEKDPARAKQIVEKQAFLEFRITDMQNQFRAALPAMDAALKKAGVTTSSGAQQSEAATPSQVQKLLGADTGKAAKDSAAADTTLQQGGALSSLLYQGAVPGEFLVPEESRLRVDSLIHLAAVTENMPRGIELLWGNAVQSQGTRAYWPLYAVNQKPIITGDQLADAKATIDQVYNHPIVTFELTRGGGRIFSRETARHIKDYMAIVLDRRVQGTPPIIESEIGRNGQIDLQNSTLQQAQDLALVLRAGALPAPLKIVDERTVGPSLGKDSIADGERAAIIGAVLVVLLVGLYYRRAGLLAILALGFYGLFTLGALASFGATLTLPGLAGFVLSIGMAVDANVLIFERMREELAQGKSARVAVDAGFQHAMPAIVDSNLTTVLTALFLFQFGTGPVKGFAVTLTVGIFASFITAVFITRTFFLIWLQRRNPAKELVI